MKTTDENTDKLIARAEQGDRVAAETLMDRHRERLKRMIVVRLDRRVSARVDPSDVVQEAMLDASQQLVTYAKERPLPFYPWLRQVALTRLAKTHRRHLNTKLRSVTSEERFPVEDGSRAALVQQLSGTAETASKIAERNESLLQIEEAVDRLPDLDREVLVLRYVEQLPLAEAAAVLEISPNTFAQRHARAIARLRTMLTKGGEQ